MSIQSEIVRGPCYGGGGLRRRGMYSTGSIDEKFSEASTKTRTVEHICQWHHSGYSGSSDNIPYTIRMSRFWLKVFFYAALACGTATPFVRLIFRVVKSFCVMIRDVRADRLAKLERRKKIMLPSKGQPTSSPRK